MVNGNLISIHRPPIPDDAFFPCLLLDLEAWY